MGVCTKYPDLCLVLEYFPLGDLRNVLEGTSGQLSNELIIKLAIDIASGMQCLHKHRIIHRDLKADNIMVFFFFFFPVQIVFS